MSHRLSEPDAHPLRAWRLLAFLAALNVLNFVDRTLPQAFIVDITQDLGLSYTQFALMNGPLFAIVYAVTGLIAGALADSVHRPRLIALGVTIWSAMTLATGFARTLGQFGAARALVAIGEASLSPSALSMLAQVFTPQRQGLATSIYYLGISVGAGGAYVIAGSLGAEIGWRGCFIALGMLGLLLAFLCLRFADPRQPAAALQKPDLRALTARVGDAFGELRRSRVLGCTWLAAVFITFSQGASVLDQAWLVHEAGLSVARAQSLVGVVFLAGSLVGAIAGGLAADAFRAKWRAGRLYYLMVLIGVLSPAALWLRFTEPGSIVFVVLLFLGSSGFTAFYGAILPTIQEFSPDKLRATLVATTLLGMALVGSALGNLFAGFFADQFAAAGWGTPLRGASLLTYSVTILALPCLVIGARALRAPEQGDIGMPSK